MLERGLEGLAFPTAGDIIESTTAADRTQPDTYPPTLCKTPADRLLWALIMAKTLTVPPI